MTSTPVKDVSPILTNLTTKASNKSGGVGQSGFQAVLNDQTRQNAQDQVETGKSSLEKKPVEQSAQKPQTKPGESLKAKEPQTVQAKEEDSMPKESVEELSPEELEAAMEILGTAAADLIQQVADLLEIPAEQVQSLMEDLGMETLDVLDPAKLTELFVQAVGAQDSCELVTDETMYGDYRKLMAQLETVLEVSADKLQADPEQLKMLTGMLKEQPAVESQPAPKEVFRQEEVIPKREQDVPTQAQKPEEQIVETVRKPQPQSEGNSSKEQDSGKEQTTKEEPRNIFIQNLSREVSQPAADKLAEPMMAAADRADTENIMRQIMDYMKIQLKADTTNLEMQLHPASLGTVQVQIASRAGVVTANFIAQNETVKAALESQMVQLIERFDEQGVKVEAIEVTVQTHEFERNLEQGRGGEQQNGEPDKKSRTRRINLHDVVSMEDMEEEDALAADIMAANGNTVDYTA